MTTRRDELAQVFCLKYPDSDSHRGVARVSFAYGYEAGHADGEASGRIKGIKQVIEYLESEELTECEAAHVSAFSHFVRQKFGVKDE